MQQSNPAYRHSLGSLRRCLTPVRTAALFLLCWLPLSGLLAAPAPGSCRDPAATMLWRVDPPSPADRSLSLQVLGSIHVGHAELYPLATPVEQAIAAAETLVFEVDPIVLAAPATAEQIRQRGLLPTGQLLGDLLSPDTEQQLQAALDLLGLPLAAITHLQPWLVTMLLTNLQVQQLGYSSAHGVESYLLQRKAATAAIGELEGLEQQLALLQSVDQEALLRYSLEGLDQAASQLEALLAAWRCGDHALLQDLLFEDLAPGGADDQTAAGAGDPRSTPPAAQREALLGRLFTERNRHMADGIARLLETGDGDYLVTVGAGHLLGEQNVLQLLRERGFAVTAVRR